MHRLLAAIAFAATVAAPNPGQRGRPVILLVHGRGLIGGDTTALRHLWFNALVSGARRIDRDLPIDEGDVRLVWYADVLDPRSSEGCDYTANDPRARRAAASDPDLENAVAAVGGFLDAITGVFDDSEVGSELRSVAGDVGFLSDARKRCASEQRLADAIDRAHREGRPVIVVAHSLGSIVAYDYLSTRTDSAAVRRLITVGSMVGSSDLRRLLVGGDSTDTLSVPKSVVSWINIRNEDDPFAAPVTVARDITTPVAKGEMDPHEMVGYLRNAVTARAVLTGWCAAFMPTRPASCSDFVRAAP